MKAEAQRIAIAEFCGFKPSVANVGHKHEKVDGFWYGGRFRIGTISLPKYTTCLNAMREAESRLTEAQASEYAHRLQMMSQAYCKTFQAIHASVEQRNEAFLRVTNRWIDDTAPLLTE